MNGQGRKMKRSEQFWDKIAEKYARRPIADEAAYRKKVELTREFLRQDMRVLEIGCGTGSTAITHAPFVAHVHAIDSSSRMIEIAQRKAGAAGVGNITFESSSTDALTAPHQAYDLVLVLNVLHLLKNRPATLSKLHTLLKPGGILVGSTPCLGDSWLRYLRWVAPIGESVGLMPPVYVFTSERLAQDMTDAGFQTELKWQPDVQSAVFMVARKPR
jgi:2-polyprenyl-3-methyl-5-hydroxy-6-metoxy-1,4-benzoquinol methylase